VQIHGSAFARGEAELNWTLQACPKDPMYFRALVAVTSRVRSHDTLPDSLQDSGGASSRSPRVVTSSEIVSPAYGTAPHPVTMGHVVSILDAPAGLILAPTAHFRSDGNFSASYRSTLSSAGTAA